MLESDLCEQFFEEYCVLCALGQFKSDLFVYHIANERKTSIQHHAKLKRMGVVKGVADYCIIIGGGRTAYIEFKRNLAECRKLNEEQEYFKTWCIDHKIPYLLTCSVEEAINFLKSL